LVFLGACKAYIAGKIFDRDRNLIIYLLPGLEAQKVQKHWHRRIKMTTTTTASTTTSASTTAATTASTTTSSSATTAATTTTTSI